MVSAANARRNPLGVECATVMPYRPDHAYQPIGQGHRRTVVSVALLEGELSIAAENYAFLGHRVSVRVCVVLGHGQRLPGSIKCFSPLLEPSKIAIRQPPVEPLGFHLCALDEVLADRRAEPQEPRLVELRASLRDLERSLQNAMNVLLQCPEGSRCRREGGATPGPRTPATPWPRARVLQELGRVMPDYERRREDLTQRGIRLTW